MLDPRDRGALLEALRPPTGYVVDRTIATTYTLDLLALLTAPLAFSLFDQVVARDEKQGFERLDSLALVHAVRQHAERLLVFCEAGCIARPKAYRQLLTYLEETIIQVRAPRPEGVFHPKVWIQRFTCEDGPVRYRVLVLSRNLTFDRSWDTVLTLDGELMDRKLSIAESKPLSEFVEALPSLAVAPETMTEGQRAAVRQMADEIRRVRFEIPEGFSRFRIWPLGLDGRKSDPFKETRIERLLCISPFLATKQLEVLSTPGKKHVLVSRMDQLEAIPRRVLERFAEVLVLSDAAEEGDETDEHESETASRETPPARGLHAKLYIADDGWDAHVWTGSANASDAAFYSNVEILVQLTGAKARVGVDATLDGKGDGVMGLRSLLGTFVPPEEPIEPTETEKTLDELLTKGARALARTEWIARVEASPGSEELYMVTLSPRAPLHLPLGCTARVWPITLSSDRMRDVVEPQPGLTFERCSFQALTAFFAFEVTATANGRVDRKELVVRVTLLGAPENRMARVIHGLLDEPEKVLRFLQMLLSLESFEAFDLLDPLEDPADGGQNTQERARSAVPLFESMVRALERDPHRLVEVERVVRDLRATPEGAKLLPADFDTVWSPLWEAFQSIQRLDRGRRAR